MKTQTEIRTAFWEQHPDLEREARRNDTRSRSQNAQTTDCRVAFTDFVDSLERTGQISAELANRATL